jgi:hypothetical protein
MGRVFCDGLRKLRTTNHPSIHRNLAPNFRRRKPIQKGEQMNAYNIILEAAFLGYHLTSRDAQEILALFTGDNLPAFLQNYLANYES